MKNTNRATRRIFSRRQKARTEKLLNHHTGICGRPSLSKREIGAAASTHFTNVKMDKPLERLPLHIKRERLGELLEKESKEEVDLIKEEEQAENERWLKELAEYEFDALMRDLDELEHDESYYLDELEVWGEEYPPYPFEDDDFCYEDYEY